MLDRPKRVYVGNRDFMSRIEISFITKTPEGRYVDYYDPERHQWRREPIREGQTGQGPTIVLDDEDAIDLYRELHKYFSMLGVKNKQESFIEGELAGTKRHLADIRHLLKMPKGIPNA